MEKPAQLELFSQAKADFEAKVSQRPFWSFVRGYEKIIIIIICLIITGVISYCLGVERGRQAEAVRLNSRMDMAAQVVVTRQAQQQPVVEVPKPKVQELNSQEEGDNYTIQLASYKSKSAAQQEAARLKNRGLSALVLSKGTYMVLCVGHFPDKEKAKVQLTEMKKKYKDCFIRRL